MQLLIDEQFIEIIGKIDMDLALLAYGSAALSDNDKD